MLTRYAWLSVAAALVTITLKTWAWQATGSVGLLSDALESLINLAAALLALSMLRLAAAPPDAAHPFGRFKAEYFSSGIEGALIVFAAVSIAYAALPRLLDPRPIAAPLFGIALSALASAVNLGCGWLLIAAGRRLHSIALEADGHHLMTDVWTSAGVIIALVAVLFTGWQWLDPVIAIGVAINILWTGYRLLRRSALGLLDRAVPASQRAAIGEVLSRYEAQGAKFHALRTRQAAGRSFVSVHVLVPGAWTVQRGHELLEEIERDIRVAVPNAAVLTHLEPVEDPTSFLDGELDR
jgi:cation diffusion facilitator family transporter